MSEHKKRPVCDECKGQDITFEALVYWNEDILNFEVAEILNKGHYCAVCDGECSIDWI